MLRILTSSLLKIPMFNSIIITYFIPLADEKDEVRCNFMLEGPLRQNFVSFYSFILA